MLDRKVATEYGVLITGVLSQGLVEGGGTTSASSISSRALLRTPEALDPVIVWLSSAGDLCSSL